MVKRLFVYYFYLLIVWGLFRYFVHLPEVIEELWFKPVVWLTPIFWWQLSMKEKIKFFGKKKTATIALGILVGMFYFVLIKRFNLSEIQLNWDLAGVALATAITEELTFSGFAAGFLEKLHKGKWTNLIVIGLMTSIIRLPILVFVYRLGMFNLIGVLLFAGASGVINAWIRNETEDVTGSIVARAIMNLAVLG